MNLNEIDTWTPEMYYEYYQKLMPFYETWYNTLGGYRPVAIGRNITWWLEKGETTRKCFIKKRKDKDECKLKTDDCHMVLEQYSNEKMSCWGCSESSNSKRKKRALLSSWERYYNIFDKILWDIETIKKSNALKTTRSLYWHNSIRDVNIKNIRTYKSWNEIIGSNLTLDIDIENKHIENMFDKWEHLPSMVSDVASKLEEHELEYKIMSSGNGIYFITKRIIYDTDKEDNESREVFWNKMCSGWKEFIMDELKPLFNKHPKFDVDGEEPYSMKFYKSPFSLHQRLDLSAIPLSIDTINDMSGKDFKELSDPTYVSNNWESILKAWK